MAAERLFAGVPVRLGVSDPWEFETQAGTGSLCGRVRAIEVDAVVIDLDVPVSYGGASFDVAHARARYQGEHAADAGEREVVCNVELHGAGRPVRLIATLRRG